MASWTDRTLLAVRPAPAPGGHPATRVGDA